MSSKMWFKRFKILKSYRMRQNDKKPCYFYTDEEGRLKSSSMTMRDIRDAPVAELDALYSPISKCRLVVTKPDIGSVHMRDSSGDLRQIMRHDTQKMLLNMMSSYLQRRANKISSHMKGEE